MTCAWAALPTCRSRGLRAYLGVNAHVQGLACEQHTMPGAVAPKARAQAPSIGGNCTTRGSDTPATRQRRASCSAKPPTATGMEGAGGTAGPGRTTSRRAEHTPAHPAPQVWRAPEGPEGTGGLRGAAPNDVRPPSLAGGRALRRPQHPWGHKQTSDNQRHTATRSVL